MAKHQRCRLTSCLTIVIGCMATVAAADERVGSALEIARHLDVMSFHNSIRPRAEPGKRLLADYGFVDFAVTPDGKTATSLERDGEWYVTVEVMSVAGDDAVLCIQDVANNGGTYRSEILLPVHRGQDGLYHAAVDKVDGMGACSTFTPLS